MEEHIGFSGNYFLIVCHKRSNNDNSKEKEFGRYNYLIGFGLVLCFGGSQAMPCQYRVYRVNKARLWMSLKGISDIYWEDNKL